MMKVMTIFPTSVGMFKLDREISEEEKRLVVDEEQNSVENVKNFIGRNSYILEVPELSNLKKFFENSLNEFFYTLHGGYDDSVSMYITQSWLNYTKPNQAHHIHAHKNSIISGVFYFNADINFDLINLYTKNFLQDDHININPKEVNAYNTECVSLLAETGRLYLFNSKIPHDVPSTKNNATRISLAFNSFVRGKIGDIGHRTELIL